MRDAFYEGGRPVLEDWRRTFAPAEIMVRCFKTGKQVREPSLVAAQVRAEDGVMERCLAAGEAARTYADVPGAVVFSPLREGQVACYDGARFLFKALLRQMGPPLPKPLVCVRVQDRTTQVEEIALTDALIQAGARKVLLYRGPLSEALDRAAERKELRHALVMHIESGM
ncbi:hypothetical protein C816_00871 [Oscillibacter sp. 1-3]|nr:hypothetical protein C816_00871 [Oscillibacter sp. 1-3]